jgi:AraC-like DNA-binding protein
MPVSARDATDSSALTPRVFSTAGLPAAERIELWESHNAAALIGLTVDATESLDATEVNVLLPHARLARVTGSPHAVERTPDIIGCCPADAIAVYLTLRGEARFTCRDGTLARKPGDALVCETDLPFARGFTHGLDELVVTVPRSALTARAPLGRLNSPVLASFRATATMNPYARALARITGRAAKATCPLLPDERTVLDLVTVLAAGKHAAHATAHRAAAHSYIEEHLADPNLGANEVATAIGISERQLSRVFAADGTSVPRQILSRRLQLAHSILRASAPGTSPESDGGPAPAVADVAARCGFTSATYFSHAFRQHFGYRASEVRHML